MMSELVEMSWSSGANNGEAPDWFRIVVERFEERGTEEEGEIR